ncbi:MULTISPECIES: hypothetical protein [Bacillus]|uniref:Uncharacterized protein n=2 Tax=Bacillus infantis TaxID=324767 RepID=U5LDI7_9BACI|nr:MULTISPECIES: hypothetical protein [Bacillus]AGX04746.1 hypothetical protein N288_14230 [Bacillus infantis NRRL B-14911]EAR68173.1 hypothetical protein B14911_25980 [Bacillus sp. NRRL B-14911]MCP1158838.1 hypothetical protein [Bacillus infantis]TYS64931.1 hypothetical protein FZD47_06120 [Bacillus infantis]
MLYQKFLTAIAVSLIFSLSIYLIGFIITGREPLLDTLLGLFLTIMFSLAGTLFYGLPVSLLASAPAALFKGNIALQTLFSVFIYGAFTFLAFLLAEENLLLRGSVITCSILFFLLDILFDTRKRRWIFSVWSRKNKRAAEK